MEGVTTAIVAFIFACLIWPHIIKHKPQFYSAVGMILLVILFDAIGHIHKDTSLSAVMYVFVALLQIMTILLLLLCVGGLTVAELRNEVSETVQAIRRGNVEDKPVLVPLRGEVPMPREVDRSPLPLEPGPSEGNKEGPAT